MAKRENKFQANLIKEIYQIFGKDECLVMKCDPNYIQGIPDLLVLYRDRWALLECKREEDAIHQANQDYYVEWLNGLSYSSFIYPENKEAVLIELQQALRP